MHRSLFNIRGHKDCQSNWYKFGERRLGAQEQDILKTKHASCLDSAEFLKSRREQSHESASENCHTTYELYVLLFQISHRALSLNQSCNWLFALQLLFELKHVGIQYLLNSCTNPPILPINHKLSINSLVFKILPTSALMVSLLIGLRKSGIAAGKACLGF